MKYPFFISLCILVWSCSKPRNDDCITSMGEPTSSKRTVASDIYEIYVEVRIQLVLIQDSTKAGQLEIEAPAGIIDQITSLVEGPRLILRNNNTCNFVRSFDYEVVVRLYIKSISLLHAESIAEITTEGDIHIDDLRIFNYALATSTLNLTGGQVYVQSNNSAQTILKGTIATLKGSIEEISDLDARNLMCKEVLLDSHTPLECYINASEGIYVNLYNSGNIFYTQEPNEYKLVGKTTSTGQLLPL